MKRYKIIISLAAIICGLMIACDNTDYSNKAPFDNMVYIKEASNSNSERVTFRNTLNEQKRAFSAKLTYPAGKDIVVKLKADPGLINDSMPGTGLIMECWIVNIIACRTAN